MTKWVYLFDEGNKDMRELLGGKGAGLAEMTRAGLPVPPGFTITTEACNAYFKAGHALPDGLWDQVCTALDRIEQQSWKKFGDPENPLLLSVRSGAKFSMPGMMDTVLNIGMTADIVEHIATTGDDRWFSYDCYRRLIQMFGHTVKHIDDEVFDVLFNQYQTTVDDGLGASLTAAQLEEIVAGFKVRYQQFVQSVFPEDPMVQLREAIEGVFASWFGKRAVDYRNYNKIPHDLGTAVNVMAMVYGNRGSDSATGVAFTRNPATGEKKLYGEYLMNAQGEDVVAGIRTPQKIDALQKDLPESYAQFQKICKMLDTHYRDMQDLEFTIEQGTLYILQTRTGKRTARAAVKIAVDMVHEGMITKKEAIQRIAPEQIDQLLLPAFDPVEKKAAVATGKLLGTGLNASPGAAAGIVAFDADTAKSWGEAGEAVILVRPETTPDDVHGMLQAKGILTQRGGATSHAAVVARGLGKPCITGCEMIRVDTRERRFYSKGLSFGEGEPISIDGTTGEVFSGLLATISPDFSREKNLVELLGWADAVCDDVCRQNEDGSFKKGLQVWANAEYPRDARIARDFGARGIGLCRTEHMFFEQDRLSHVHQMILNATEAQGAYNAVSQIEKELALRPDDPRMGEEMKAIRQHLAESEAVRKYEAALQALLAFQRKDFEGIFEAMDGLPVIIRLIDPPLHEFLPRYEELLEEITVLKTRIALIGKLPENLTLEDMPSIDKMKTELDQRNAMLNAVKAMRESNPMLGMRGIRLGLCFPGIVKMQVQAIFEAACGQARRGIRVLPEIMIPLTGHVNELKASREMLEAVALEVIEANDQTLDYKFGTMIEVPRSALTASAISEQAEFFSFGTNDLTQMTYGYSRDDAEGKFLRYYIESGILPENPFQVIDEEGVGRLIRMAVTEGRQTRPDLEVGICGEHGGNPPSIQFCHQAGLDYVSCSPYRVLTARLAAAQAALGGAERDK